MSLPMPAHPPQVMSSLEDRFALLDKLEALSEALHAAVHQRKSYRFLLLGVKAWRDGRIEAAGRAAARAVRHDDTNVAALQLLGRYLARMGYTHKALVTYERAHQLAPDDPDTLIYLGMVAHSLGEFEAAEKMFRLHIAARPTNAHGYNNLSNTLCEVGRYDDAIEVLRSGLALMPHEAVLWSSLGMALTDVGRVAESFVFFQEAIRLVPDFGAYYHNLGYAYQHSNCPVEALECYDKALELGVDPSDTMEMRFSRSVCLLDLGRLEEGFAAFELRLNQRFRGNVDYVVNAPYWNGESVAGKKVLIGSEQGLGDEIMFASILPDVARAVGPEGKLYLACDSRMVALLRRSFPDAIVGNHVTAYQTDENGKRKLRLVPHAMDENNPDYWALMGSPFSWYRKRIEDFPKEAFLKPDPARVTEFRDKIAAGRPGLLVGICWRSMLLKSNRAKFYSSLDLWGPILQTPGVRFVNLQYDQCTDELAMAEELFGVKIEVVDGLDLTHDIDGAAALSAAVDLVISAPTAAAAIAGAVGTETWFMTAGRTWPQLGTMEFPWYRKTTAFVPAAFGDWVELIPRIAAALKERSDAAS